MGEVPPTFSNYPRQDPGGSPGGRPPGVYLDFVGEAWRIVMDHKQVLFPGMVVAGLVYIVVYAIQFGVMAATGGFTQRPDDVGPMLANQGISLVLSFAVMPLQFGLQWQALRVVRNEPATVTDMLEGYRRFGTIIVVAFLTGLLTLVGTCLCIVPGLLIAGMLQFAGLLALDKRMGPIQTIETCLKVFRPHMWWLILFTLVYSIIGSLGAVLCGVGVIVTYPIYMVAIAYHYNLFFPPATAPGSVIGASPPI